MLPRHQPLERAYIAIDDEDALDTGVVYISSGDEEDV
jgi:hypothetical protein